MIETQSFVRVYDIPSDGKQAHSDLVSFIDGAKHSIRLEIYGFTDPDLADALARASMRGVDVRLLLDHTQSTGPTEAAILHRLMLAGFPPDHLTITTSPMHQIFHRKRLTVDADADVPDAQFDTLDAARAAGYPLVVTGSTNWSPTAFRQTNDLIVMPGRLYAKLCVNQFDAQWAWARANEPTYQMAS